MGEYEVIDRHFQPCYIDGCPEEGVNDLQIAPGEWRSFCQQHTADRAMHRPPSPPKPARSRAQPAVVPNLHPGDRVIRSADLSRGWPAGTVQRVLHPDARAGRPWKRAKAYVQWDRRASGGRRLGGDGTHGSLIDCGALKKID